MLIHQDIEASRIAHLGFIQGVINRMGNNSFLLKGWTITIIAALFALSAENTKIVLYTSLYIPNYSMCTKQLNSTPWKNLWLCFSSNTLLAFYLPIIFVLIFVQIRLLML